MLRRPKLSKIEVVAPKEEEEEEKAAFTATSLIGTALSPCPNVAYHFLCLVTHFNNILY
jgi:hypothetical protein